jgi:hypothetical protein
LKSNANGREFSVEIEVPIHHHGLQISPNPNFGGLPDLGVPVILKEADCDQQDGDSTHSYDPENWDGCLGIHSLGLSSGCGGALEKRI